MSATTPTTPAGSAGQPDQSEPVYVKLPPPGTVHASRRPQNAPNPLVQVVLTIFAFVLIASLPVSAGAILLLIMIQPATAGHGFFWIWIPLFVFVVGMGVLVAYGLWREVTGWSRRGDYEA